MTDAPLLLIDLQTEDGVTGRSYLFGYQNLTLKPLADLVLAMGDMIRRTSS
jgi:mandelate racemase